MGDHLGIASCRGTRMSRVVVVGLSRAQHLDLSCDPWLLVVWRLPKAPSICLSTWPRWSASFVIQPLATSKDDQPPILYLSFNERKHTLVWVFSREEIALRYRQPSPCLPARWSRSQLVAPFCLWYKTWPIARRYPNHFRLQNWAQPMGDTSFCKLRKCLITMHTGIECMRRTNH